MMPTKSQTATKVTELMGAVDNVSPVRNRALEDMPSLVHHPGAKEVAILTVVAKEQAFAFKPVMDALNVLASSKIDWSRDFLVAHDLKGGFRGPDFNWRKAPHRKYKSFQDFYHQELEAVWGDWENLQATYAKVVRREITEEEGQRIILRGRGRPKKDEKPCNDPNVTRFSGNYGTKLHILARLNQANAPDLALKNLTRADFVDLATRVRAKTLSANAAAIEAGFRKRVVRKKLTAVERALKVIGKLTKVERKVVWQQLDHEFGRRK
jgi:hypothetical protein